MKKEEETGSEAKHEQTKEEKGSEAKREQAKEEKGSEAKQEQAKEETKGEHRVYLTTEVVTTRNAANKKVVNEFVLLDTIGHGGFSKVKRVQHQGPPGSPPQFFAMKIMHKPTLKRERALGYEKDGSPTMTNNLEKVREINIIIIGLQ